MIVSNFTAAKVICFARIAFDFCLIDFVFCSKYNYFNKNTRLCNIANSTRLQNKVDEIA